MDVIKFITQCLKRTEALRGIACIFYSLNWFIRHHYTFHLTTQRTIRAVRVQNQRIMAQSNAPSKGANTLSVFAHTNS